MKNHFLVPQGVLFFLFDRKRKKISGKKELTFCPDTREFG
jgi:hypothetical protein